MTKDTNSRHLCLLSQRVYEHRDDDVDLIDYHVRFSFSNYTIR